MDAHTDLADPRAALAALLDPSLDPLLWHQPPVTRDSAWHGHVPFAYWAMMAARPALFVELGTFGGVSYCAFCEAVVRGRLPTRCAAVDTWQGDEHNGFYGAHVLAGLRRYHDPRYAAFSDLRQMTFDEALPQFADGSIDLLHIDGCHTYKAVRHDFESWRPKLSRRGVVLMHDTAEHDRNFGVWRLMAELRGHYPCFEFLHEHGLGVVAVGEDAPPALAALCALRDPAEIGAVRTRFAALGERARADALAEADRDDARAAELAEERRMRQRAAAAAAAARQAAAAAQEQADALRPLAEATQEWRRQAGAQKARAEAVEQHVARMQQHVAATEQRQRDAEQRQRDAEQREADTAQRLTEALAAVEQARQELATASQLVAALPDPAAIALARRIPGPALPALRGVASVRRRMRGLPAPPPISFAPHLPLLPAAPAPLPAEAVPAPIAEIVPPPEPAARRDPSPLRRDDAPLAVVVISGEPETPGHAYRVLRPAAAAALLGAGVTCLSVAEAAARLDAIEAADIVVLWRVRWSPEVAHLVGAARWHGARVVFDVDDRMTEPDLARPDVIDAIRSLKIKAETVREHYADIRMTMYNADFSLATTEELATAMRMQGATVLVSPNAFDTTTWRASRRAVRARAGAAGDGLLRLGYPTGTRTHQRDFAQIVPVIAQTLRARPECRLVLFAHREDQYALVNLHEFPELAALESQIEWRDLVPLDALPAELARFDINLAPLEIGNPFCEAKSELKYFEAALVEVPTIASPTGPFRRAIAHGRTGLLATTPEEWHAAVTGLLDDAALRQRIGRAAYLDVLWRFGPEQQLHAIGSVIEQALGGRRAARAFGFDQLSAALARTPPDVPAHETVFAADAGGDADVTVVVPLYNYAQFITDALDSVHAQTLASLDVIVIDDRSTDDSLAIAIGWMERHAGRFNRAAVLRNAANSGLGLTRNVGFANAETPWVLPLDADNRLLAPCLEELLRVAHGPGVGAGFVYPVIREIGDRDGLMGTLPYQPARLIGMAYIDAMALVSLAAWAHVGGYGSTRLGWEDYEFWCRLAERGVGGCPAAGAPLAEYRVHGGSMLATTTNRRRVKRQVVAEMQAAHPWLHITAGYDVADPDDDRPDTA